MPRPARESLRMLKKGMKRGKIIKMFGEPDKSDRPGDAEKQLYGERLERANYSDERKKKLLSMERLAYVVPGGQVCLVLIFDKLDAWNFFPG